MIDAVAKKININNLNLPYPPEGSNCDHACGGGLPYDDFHVWSTEDMRSGYVYAQEIMYRRTHVTGTACVIAKDSVEMDNPFYFGIAKESVVSNPDLFFDASNWEPLEPGSQYHAYAVDPSLLETAFPDFYIISAPWNLTFNQGETYYFVCLTINSTSALYDSWMVGGFKDSRCEGTLQTGYWDIDLGVPFSWTPSTTDDFELAIYAEGGTPPNQGLAHYENPVFPANVGVGESYYFSFDLYNMNDPNCGCPETMIFDIIDRINDPTGLYPFVYGWGELPCGSYFNIDDVMGFTEPGVYSLQLRVGHLVVDEYIIDETYDFNVNVTGEPPNCSDYTTQTECEAAGCYWWNDSCHDVPNTCSPEGATQCFGEDMYVCTSGAWVLQQENHPDCLGECAEYHNKTDCVLAGCYWYKKYFWEMEKCYSERYDWFQAYLPFIIAGGVGVASLVAFSLLRTKPAPVPQPQPYYRPPYPPAYYGGR